MQNAFEYVQNSGIESERDYPYQAVDQSCQFSSSKSVFKATGYVNVPQSESSLLDAVGKWTKTDSSQVNYPEKASVLVFSNFNSFLLQPTSVPSPSTSMPTICSTTPEVSSTIVPATIPWIMEPSQWATELRTASNTGWWRTPGVPPGERTDTSRWSATRTTSAVSPPTLLTHLFNSNLEKCIFYTEIK